MPASLIDVILLLHIVAALFWLGSSYMVAQRKGRGAERQYKFQMIAATVTVLAGGYLWPKLHPLGIGKGEVVLGIGALCAVAAAGLQGMMVGAPLRKMRAGALSEDAGYAKIRTGYRWSTVLLAVALLAMFGWSHV
jgi:hypothetical protein